MCIIFSSSPNFTFSFSQVQSQLLFSYLKPCGELQFPQLQLSSREAWLGWYQFWSPCMIRVKKTFPKLLSGLVSGFCQRQPLCSPLLTKHCYPPLRKMVNTGIFPCLLPSLKFPNKICRFMSYWILWLILSFFVLWSVYGNECGCRGNTSQLLTQLPQFRGRTFSWPLNNPSARTTPQLRSLATALSMRSSCIFSSGSSSTL